MQKQTYTVGTEEAALKLGLSPRQVRRLGAQGILEGKKQATSTGHRWFFDARNVDLYAERLRERREREDRRRTAKDVLAEDRGSPRKSEDASADGPGRPTVASGEVDRLSNDLTAERSEHKDTRGKLDQALADLRAKSEDAARLAAEKSAAETIARDRKQIITELMEGFSKMRLLSGTDAYGHVPEDVPGQPRKLPVMSEDASDAPPEPIEIPLRDTSNSRGKPEDSAGGETPLPGYPYPPEQAGYSEDARPGTAT